MGSSSCGVGIGRAVRAVMWVLGGRISCNFLAYANGCKDWHHGGNNLALNFSHFFDFLPTVLSNQLTGFRQQTRLITKI